MFVHHNTSLYPLSSILYLLVFPGLWLQPAALWAGDLAALLDALQEGLASPEHARFVGQLKARMTVAGWAALDRGLILGLTI
jgi:hypothetical protein